MLLDIIARAKSWDHQAFGELYDISYDRIYRMIFHRTLDDAFTEDIISEVYMKAMKSIWKLRGNSEWEFFSWLQRIAYTTLIDTLRRERPIESFDILEWEPTHHENFGENLDNKDTLEKVLSYMDTIPERDRMILTLRIWDDLSYDEISQITGESLSNAKKIVSRTLEKIAANISELIVFSLLLQYVIQK